MGTGRERIRKRRMLARWTIGMTSRASRERDRVGRKDPAMHTSEQHASHGNGRNARGIRHGRSTIARARSMRNPLPTAGERRLRGKSQAKRGARDTRTTTTTTTRSSPATRRTENIRGEWRTLPAATGVKGIVKRSAQERNLTPHTKPSLHWNAR